MPKFWPMWHVGKYQKSIYQTSNLPPSDFSKIFFISSFLFEYNERLLIWRKIILKFQLKKIHPVTFKIYFKNLIWRVPKDLFLVTFNINISYIFTKISRSVSKDTEFYFFNFNYFCQFFWSCTLLHKKLKTSASAVF